MTVPLAVLLTTAPYAGQQPSQEPRFRGGANLVRLDVYASKDGVAVADLTAADFEVREDNALQEVSSFEFVKAREVVPDSARAEPSTVAESRDRAAQPDARVFVLFLDTAHVQIEGSYHAQNPVSALLDRVVGENDLVGVMTPDMSARNMTFSPRTASIGEMLRTNWTWGERGRVNTSDPRDQELQACYADAGDTAGMAKALIERRHEMRTLEAIEDVLDQLESQREQRSFLLLLSEGWTLPGPDELLARAIKLVGGGRQVPGGSEPIATTPNGRLGVGRTLEDRSLQSCERERSLLALADVQTTFRLLIQRANRANVSFYPIDPRGLIVFDDAIGPTRPAGPAADAMRLTNRQNSLRTLAEETDGAVVLNTNIDTALPRLLNDVGSYYLLGYVSTNQKLDGRFRKLSVKVNRPGIEVRARPGYLAPTAADVAAARAPAEPPTSSSVDQALSRLPAGRRVAALYLHGTGGAGYLQFTLEVDRATAATPGWTQGAQVLVEIEPADGSGGASRRSETVTLAPGVRVYSLRHPESDALPPGRYQIRVQATPAGGGTRLPVTASEVVTVPKPAALLGSAALAARRGPGTGRLYVPTADPRYRRTERIRLETPLLAQRATVTARLLNRAGQPLAVPVTLTLRMDEVRQLTMSVAEVGLAPLAPGEYVVEVTATDGATTETVTYAVRLVP
ncbi:MAG TPA: VWA domain-containing protein [Vicinamibacterales bacterium]|nr:VWA domain-containing protein [Vicinamibacterales bacterium]